MDDQVIIYNKKPENFVSNISISVAWIALKDKFLFLQRSKDSSQSLLWGLPGGKIEKNETPIQAISREILEETTIVLENKKINKIIKLYIKYLDCNYTYHMFFYRCNIEPVVTISEEENDYKWLTLNQAHKIPLMYGVKKIIKIFKEQTELVVL